MALSPPANTDIATKQDVELAVATLRGDILAHLDKVQWRIIGAVVIAVLISALLG